MQVTHYFYITFVWISTAPDPII